MGVEDLYVGQHVKFRSWEDMKSEFEEDEDGDIDSGEYYFFSSMRNLCGTDFIVKVFSQYDGEILQPYFKDIDGDEVCACAWMLEEYIDMAVKTAVDTGDLL